MRKKIEELRNREEGFTLVELLAVIVILGIIVAIAIPAIGGVTESAQTGANEAENQLVLDAARLYYTAAEVDEDLKQESPITVTNLLEDGYLDKRESENIKPEQKIYKHSDGTISFDPQT